MTTAVRGVYGIAAMVIRITSVAAVGLVLSGNAAAENNIEAGLLEGRADEVVTVIITLKKTGGSAPASADATAGSTPLPGAFAVTVERVVARLAAKGLEITQNHLPVPVLVARLPRSLIGEIAQDPIIRWIRIDRKYNAHDALSNYLTNAALVRDSRVWPPGLTGKGVGIAIVDSGIDSNHPAFRSSTGGSVVQFWAATPGGPLDPEGHGTEVAGVAGGVDGIAPNATLLAVRALDASGHYANSTLLAGLDAIQRSVAAGNPYNIRVVNMSLGSDASQSIVDSLGRCDAQVPDFEAHFEMFRQKGVLTVVSSGNDGCSDRTSAPSCASSALAVGATRLHGSGLRDTFPDSTSCNPNGCSEILGVDTVSCYTNIGGMKPEIFAPADVTRAPIPLQGPGDTGSYSDSFAGTSAAAPVVSGVAALLFEAKPGASVDEVAKALQSNMPYAFCDSQRPSGFSLVPHPRVDAYVAVNNLFESGNGCLPQNFNGAILVPWILGGFDEVSVVTDNVPASQRNLNNVWIFDRPHLTFFGVHTTNPYGGWALDPTKSPSWARFLTSDIQYYYAARPVPSGGIAVWTTRSMGTTSLLLMYRNSGITTVTNNAGLFDVANLSNVSIRDDVVMQTYLGGDLEILTEQPFSGYAVTDTLPRARLQRLESLVRLIRSPGGRQYALTYDNEYASGVWYVVFRAYEIVTGSPPQFVGLTSSLEVPDASYNNDAKGVELGELGRGALVSVSTSRGRPLVLLAVDDGGRLSTINVPAAPAGSTWSSVAVGDFDGDGHVDLAGMTLESGRYWLTLLLQTGKDGTAMPIFSPAWKMPLRSDGSLVSVPLGSTGRPDILFGFGGDGSGRDSAIEVVDLAPISKRAPDVLLSLDPAAVQPGGAAQLGRARNLVEK